MQQREYGVGDRESTFSELQNMTVFLEPVKRTLNMGKAKLHRVSCLILPGRELERLPPYSKGPVVTWGVV
jgi:hypothetical protein